MTDRYERLRSVDPKSTAGILLREHDNLEQALAYAERKATALLAMHNALGLDYARAAEDLREEQARQQWGGRDHD